MPLPADADQNLAIQLLKLVAPAQVAKAYEDRLRAGGLGYAELKKALFGCYWEYFAAARAKRAELAANLDHVHKVLADGAAKARAKATRCCCPPESWSGNLRPNPASPTRSNSSFARTEGAPLCLPT